MGGGALRRCGGRAPHHLRHDDEALQGGRRRGLWPPEGRSRNRRGGRGALHQEPQDHPERVPHAGQDEAPARADGLSAAEQPRGVLPHDRVGSARVVRGLQGVRGGLCEADRGGPKDGRRPCEGRDGRNPEQPRRALLQHQAAEGPRGPRPGAQQQGRGKEGARPLPRPLPAPVEPLQEVLLGRRECEGANLRQGANPRGLPGCAGDLQQPAQLHPEAAGEAAERGRRPQRRHCRPEHQRRRARARGAGP
mmetsp:Transcript_27973/g.66459  ORF Transcript_27973/g.66459 Transcript_27973/m.66459 type:complete len:250 (+) Transcript_27973:452-1201(+)